MNIFVHIIMRLQPVHKYCANLCTHCRRECMPSETQSDLGHCNCCFVRPFLRLWVWCMWPYDNL